jgi:mersacidin/lichenicidin family type 2 lantibiotic
MQLDIVRLWKNEDYRASLSKEELATLPESPIGEIELSDADLQMIQGGQANSCTNNAYSTYDASCSCDGGNYGGNYNGGNNGGPSGYGTTSCNGSSGGSQAVGFVVLEVVPASSCYTYSSCS